MKEKHLSRHYRKDLLVLLFILFTLLTLTACGQGTDPEEINDRSSGSSDSAGEGNSTEPSEPVTDVEMPDLREELWEKAGLNAPTGKWFMHNGEGVFGYTLPQGTKRAGDELSIGLYGHTRGGDVLERTVRIQLIETTDELEKIEVVLEEESYVDKIIGNDLLFSITVPEKENVEYILNMEIIDEAGEVEDSMLSHIKVPSQELNANLSTKISKGELTITVENEGPTDLFLGTYYTSEKQVNGTWEDIILQDAFEDIGIILSANQSYQQKVNISSLNKGTYRISKDVGAEGLDLVETLSTQFVIE